MEIKTNSAVETKQVAFKLGEMLFPGSLIILTGDLGAGKTTFTQGLAKGLGITKTVSSPTFTILKIYQGNLPLYHMDAYRLEGLHQDLGFEEMMEDDGVCVIEWPIYIQDSLPKERLEVSIQCGFEDERILQFIPIGKRYEKLMEDLI